MSSWTSEKLWLNSTAAAAGGASCQLPPAAAQQSNVRSGRTRLPPDCDPGSCQPKWYSTISLSAGCESDLSAPTDSLSSFSIESSISWTDASGAADWIKEVA